MTTRTAVVTGGSRGIGFSVARQLLSSGIDVVVTGRDATTLEAARHALGDPAHVRVLSFDASDPVVADDALRAIDADVLVANVGMGFSGTVAGTTYDQWNHVMATNVTSAFVAIRAVLDGMLAREWGRIVTVGSIASHVPLRYGVVYTASKHALLGLTRAVAEETRGRGVTANLVAPAFVRTDMTLQNISQISNNSGLSTHIAEQKLARLSSLNRLLEPDEVATEVLRFISDDYAKVTGTSVPMGFELSLGAADANATASTA